MRRIGSPLRWVAFLVVVLAGAAIRWWFMRSSQGALSADEAYTGLQALRILDGDVPIVIEGQAYTAVFDSYLLAPLLAIFGSSVVIVKVLPIVWWAIVSLLVARIVRAMSDVRTGWLAGALTWIAPAAMLVVSTRAYEGYGLGVICVLLVCIESRRAMVASPIRWRDSLACGLFVGLAVWLHPMYLAVVVPLIVLPSWRNRRNVRSWWWPLSMGSMVAMFPLLVWNLRNDWQTLKQPTPSDKTYLSRLASSFTELVPRVFGLRNSDGSWTHSVVVVVVVLVVLGVLCARGFVHLWRGREADRVVGLTFVLVWPLLAVFRSTDFVVDGRYGIVSFPFVVMTMALGIREFARKVDFRTVYVISVVLWVSVLSIPWLRIHDGVRSADPNRDVRGVIDVVRSRGFDRVSGSFWWVLPIEYLSDRAIRGGVADQPFTVRVVDSQTIVSGSDPEDVPFVFAAGDEQIDELRLPITSYEKVEVGEAVVYLPTVGR